MASRSSKWRYSWLMLGVAGFLALAEWKGWLPKDGIGAGQRGPVVLHKPERPGKPGAQGTRKIGAWEELHGCILVEDRDNDGDSFVVRHEGADHILRIYFADCPEKHRHQYNGPRIAEQGQYFGGLTEEETVAIGGDARDFSLALLREGPFTVLTRWEKVFDSGRFYAFVTVGERDLGERLVEQGLARIYTKGENRPGGITVAAEKRRLQGMEQAARRANRGAWGKR